MVIAITQEPKKRGYQRRLAERFSVGRGAINLVVRGVTWSHLTGIKRSPVRNALKQLYAESRAAQNEQGDITQRERNDASEAAPSSIPNSGAGDFPDMPDFLRRDKAAAE